MKKQNIVKLEKNQYGYLHQARNRYFIRVGASVNYNAGFISLKQFEQWLANEFKKHGFNWQVGYNWKYVDSKQFCVLEDRYGNSINDIMLEKLNKLKIKELKK